MTSFRKPSIPAAITRNFHGASHNKARLGITRHKQFFEGFGGGQLRHVLKAALYIHTDTGAGGSSGDPAELPARAKLFKPA